MKSKRHCLGYDPVFQSQGPQSIHPAPTSNPTSSSSSSTNASRRYNIAPTDTSPSIASQAASIGLPSPHDQPGYSRTDYNFPRPPEHLLPHLNQPYQTENNAYSIPHVVSQNTTTGISTSQPGPSSRDYHNSHPDRRFVPAEPTHRSLSDYT